ncbi:unnamed protein product [Symbiodinium natans]|uniref:Pentatricopeptide repeat-containing protein n=1 Tax=Symbiodinium natans TaxID=878477 RepID=A0A812V6X0_9DINO|nr:unnamed protein product [Symbiodinium natans]
MSPFMSQQWAKASIAERLPLESSKVQQAMAAPRSLSWTAMLGLLEVQKSSRQAEDRKTYGMVMAACARLQRWRAVARVLADLQVSGMRLDAVVVGSLVDAYKEVGMWRRAAQALRSSSSHGLEQSIISHNALLSAMGRSAQWQTGIVLQASMARSGFLTCDVVTYNAAITSCMNGRPAVTFWPIGHETPLLGLLSQASKHTGLYAFCPR